MFRIIKRGFHKFPVPLLVILMFQVNPALASSDPFGSIDTFKLPGSNVLQRTIYNPTEFTALSKSKSNYQIIYQGNLITFGPSLNYLSSEKIVSSGEAWTYQSDKSIIGMTNCKNFAFGLEECGSISNLVSGKVILTAKPANLFDAHELLVDKEGNYWFLSYPKSACSTVVILCSAYGVSQTKTFSDCQINEVNPQGDPLYIWKASDHIPSSMIVRSYLNEGPRGKFVDLFHCNSIDLVNSDSVLLSSRNTDATYLIDLATSKVKWKLGGHYWPGISLLASGFNRTVGYESVAQHDARYLGNDLFSYFDNASHTTNPARGVVFRVVKTAGSQKAVLVQNFPNQNGNSSLCTGSARKSDLNNFVVGWGCSLNAITLFDSSGSPIVAIDKIETPDTSYLFSHTPNILNGVDWGPDATYAMSYRVVPVLNS